MKIIQFQIIQSGSKLAFYGLGDDGEIYTKGKEKGDEKSTGQEWVSIKDMLQITEPLTGMPIAKD